MEIQFHHLARPQKHILHLSWKRWTRDCMSSAQRPFAITIEESREVLQAVERSPLSIAVNEMWRWIPAYQRISELLAENALGNVQSVSFSNRANFFLAGTDGETLRTHPRFLNMERLVLLEYGSHILDVFRHWFGDPERVSASVATGSPFLKGEDYVCANLSYSSFDITMEIDWSYPGDPVSDVLVCDDLVIKGSSGFITAKSGRELKLYSKRGEELESVSFGGDLRAQGFSVSHQKFAKSVEHGPHDSRALGENIRSMGLVYACYESAARNEPVQGSELEDWQSGMMRG